MRKIIFLVIISLIILIAIGLIYDKFIIKPEKKIIILMYHDLVKDNKVDEKKFKLGYEGAPYLYKRKESQFIKDMDYIKKVGYQVISLYDLLEIKNKKRDLANNSIIITFDDGPRSNYNIAFPILKKYEFKATFFVITNGIGRNNHVRWNEFREMASYKNERGENLFDIESHSHTHPSLVLKKKGESDTDYKQRVLLELVLSQKIIAKEIKKIPHFLALPGGSGAGDELIKKIAKESGYWGIRTSRWGTVNSSSDMYELNSFAVLNKTRTPVPIAGWFWYQEDVKNKLHGLRSKILDILRSINL